MPVNLSFPNGAGISTFSGFTRQGCQGFVGPDPSTFLDKSLILIYEERKMNIEKPFT